MTETSEQVVLDGSLKSRLAARRAELRDEKPFDIDVPGYEGILQVRYRSLDYPTIRAIGQRHEKISKPADKELAIAADTLVNACVCLLAIDGDEIEETRYRWDEHTARELFGIGVDEVPEGASARIAIRRIIPSSTRLMLHYAEYDERSRGVERASDKTVEGELEAA